MIYTRAALADFPFNILSLLFQHPDLLIVLCSRGFLRPFERQLRQSLRGDVQLIQDLLILRARPAAQGFEAVGHSVEHSSLALQHSVRSQFGSRGRIRRLLKVQHDGLIFNISERCKIDELLLFGTCGQVQPNVVFEDVVGAPLR